MQFEKGQKGILRLSQGADFIAAYRVDAYAFAGKKEQIEGEAQWVLADTASNILAGTMIRVIAINPVIQIESLIKNNLEIAHGIGLLVLGRNQFSNQKFFVAQPETEKIAELAKK